MTEMAIKVKPLCCNRRAGAKLFSNLLGRQFNYFLLVINWTTFIVTHTKVQSLALVEMMETFTLFTDEFLGGQKNCLNFRWGSAVAQC